MKSCTSVWPIVIMLLSSSGMEAAEVNPFANGRWIDLTHEFSSDTIYWPTEDGFKLSEEFKGETPEGFFYSANSFCAAEHGGTHIDAPVHFARGQPTLEEIPVDDLIGPAVVVDVSGKTLRDPDYQIAVDDITAFEAVYGDIPTGALLLFHTGYAQFWPDAKNYLGTAEKGEEALSKLHFPGLHPRAARWLVTNRKVKAVGLDTASIDYGQSEEFMTHRVLFENNIPVFENVARLDQMPPIGARVVALPMKIKGGSGGPLRIVAWLPDREKE